MQLSQAEITQQNQQKYFISGTVDFSTVPDLSRQSSAFFAAKKTSDNSHPDNKEVIFDLSEVEECNSAVLALMLEIVKHAKQKKLAVSFENLPATILTIARAYGVENEIRDICK